MNNNNIILKKRCSNEAGLDLYFYNIRSLMIYEYEVLYQISDGLWSRKINPDGHEIPWINANLFLTQGKSNARNVVDNGYIIPKTDYNLHRIISISTALSRVSIIGKVCNALDDDTDTIMCLLNEGFHELDYEFDNSEDFDDNSYDDFMNLMLLNGLNKSVSILDKDLFESIINAEYPYNMMRDDLGMIQNTMRNITQK